MNRLFVSNRSYGMYKYVAFMYMPCSAEFRPFQWQVTIV